MSFAKRFKLLFLMHLMSAVGMAYAGDGSEDKARPVHCQGSLELAGTRFDRVTKILTDKHARPEEQREAWEQLLGLEKDPVNSAEFFKTENLIYLASNFVFLAPELRLQAADKLLKSRPEENFTHLTALYTRCKTSTQLCGLKELNDLSKVIVDWGVSEGWAAGSPEFFEDGSSQLKWYAIKGEYEEQLRHGMPAAERNLRKPLPVITASNELDRPDLKPVSKRDIENPPKPKRPPTSPRNLPVQWGTEGQPEDASIHSSTPADERPEFDTGVRFAAPPNGFDDNFGKSSSAYFSGGAQDLYEEALRKNQQIVKDEFGFPLPQILLNKRMRLNQQVEQEISPFIARPASGTRHRLQSENAILMATKRIVEGYGPGRAPLAEKASSEPVLIQALMYASHWAYKELSRLPQEIMVTMNPPESIAPHFRAHRLELLNQQYEWLARLTFNPAEDREAHIWVRQNLLKLQPAVLYVFLIDALLEHHFNPTHPMRGAEAIPDAKLAAALRKYLLPGSLSFLHRMGMSHATYQGLIRMMGNESSWP